MIKLVRSQQKRPIDTGFTDPDYQADRKGVREWLKGGNDNTLSMVVPDGLVILDVDTEPSKSQIESMRPSDCYQITPHGRHWVFKDTVTDRPATTKVLTRLGVQIDAYRVGGKNCIMIYDPKAPRHKVNWSKLIKATISTIASEGLPALPDVFEPLDTRDMRQVLEACCYQLNWAYRQSMVGGDMLDMACASFIYDSDAENFHHYYQIIFAEKYDEKRTNISYERIRLKLEAGDKLQGVGTLVDALKVAGQDHIIKLVSIASHIKEQSEKHKEAEFDNTAKIAQEMVVMMKQFPNESRWFTIDYLKSQLHKIKIDWEYIAHHNGLKKLTKEHYRMIFIETIKSMVEQAELGIIFDEVFYIYNGKYWKPLDATEFDCMLRDTIKISGAPSLMVGEGEFLKKLYQQARETMRGKLKREQADYTIINLNNTAIKITADRVDLIPHHKSYGLTYCLPYDYDPDARCDMFMDRYLRRSLPSETFQNVLQEFLGYVFIPTYQLKLEKVLVLYGGGHNGKSVLYDVMRAMLGRDNISSCTVKDLMQEHYRAVLDHKLLNYASESPQGVDNDIFQGLASGEPTMVRQKYGKQYEMTDYAKIAFNCNELPQKSSGKDAFYRRFLIIPFGVTIKAQDKDPGLANKIIREELSGVFNWVLEGLKRIMTNKKFSHEPEMIKQLKEYQEESDTVMSWIKYGVPTGIMTYEDAYRSYKNYTIDNGHKTVAINKFKDRIVGAGHHFAKDDIGKFYIDWRVKTTREEDVTAVKEWYDMQEVIDVDKHINS